MVTTQNIEFGILLSLPGSVSIDPVVLRQNWLEAYSFATDQAAITLNAYATDNDPFADIGQRSVTVNVTSIVRSSNDSFEIRWRETSYRGGALIGTENFTAILSIITHRPTQRPCIAIPLACMCTALTGQKTLTPENNMRHSHLLKTAAIIGLVTSLGGCASLQKGFADFKLDMSRKDEVASQDVGQMNKALLEIEEPVQEERPIQIEFFEPVIMPGQMKLRPASYVTSDPVLKPFEAIEQANASASIEPNSSNYLNAIQVYPYTPGSLYQVYTAPEQVTDIALQPGEELTSVSAGDTIRWIVGDTVSGAIGGEQVHILVKPTKPNLSTNLVITTSKRTYYLELHSYKDTYMAAVSWRYPREALGLRGAKKMNRQAKAKAAPTSASPTLSIEKLNFRYEIKGDHPHWRPLRAFDDGRKVFIQFPARLDQGEAPPLFVMGRKGKNQLVNYRVKGAYYIVDRLFKVAELRLGGKKQDVVRIVRDNKS